MEKAEACKFRQGTRKTGLKGSYFKRLFRGDEVIQRLLSKELELTAAKMLRRKAVRDRVTRLDAAQQAANVRYPSTVSTTRAWRTKPIRVIELAVLANVVERAALQGQKKGNRKEWEVCVFCSAVCTRKE